MHYLLAKLSKYGSIVLAFITTILAAAYFKVRGDKYKKEADEHEKISEVKDEQIKAEKNRPRNMRELIDRIKRM